MDKLYAPWRDEYVLSQARSKSCKTDASGQAAPCVFCTVFDGQEPDDQRYVLYNDGDVAVLLNLYPYNGGHLLVIARNHVEYLHEMPDAILHKLMKLSALSMQIIKQELACEAINFGANLGRAAGAGIPEHAHLHIVPRFVGDTGFFTTIGQSKQVSVDLQKIYQRLQPYFRNITV